MEAIQVSKHSKKKSPAGFYETANVSNMLGNT